ncbi:hypothetical protein M5E06_22215 [Azospirillum sp. A1-3]|uniref:GTP pyrophosphokinase n=1 Tax=Azospirillum sp. A1-3 TaxID=185874 RepID=UPI0020777E85|nr:hypothetical protein [Azospirillum sp. A1-3]MCM8736842.1 hypothetical protein [Azospirillum sp. A1-3]
MSDHKILSQYDNNAVIYTECSTKISGLIKDLLKANGIRAHSVEARVKERDSLSGKIARKHFKYTDISEITDIVGFRIITHFNHEVSKVSSLIESNFEIDRENSIDKSSTLEPDRFGYVSIHLVSKISQSRAELFEYKNISDIKFEIQIRSILQHAWAEIEHDLGYKSGSDVPNKIRRRFSRISGLLEIADQEFSSVVSDINEHRLSIKNATEKVGSLHYEEIDIDAEFLQSYVYSNDFVERCDAYIADITKSKIDFEIDYGRTASALNWIGIKNSKELSDNVENHGDLIRDFLLDIFKNSENKSVTSIPRGISLVFLCDYLVAAEQDPYRISAYLSQIYGFPGEKVRHITEMLVKAADFSLQKNQTR